MNRSSLRPRGVLLFGLVLLAAMPGRLPCASAGQNPVEAESAKKWVGQKAKAFTLPGTDGKPVNLVRDLGKHPVVLVFYRGVW